MSVRGKLAKGLLEKLTARFLKFEMCPNTQWLNIFVLGEQITLVQWFFKLLKVELFVKCYILDPIPVVNTMHIRLPATRRLLPFGPRRGLQFIRIVCQH